MGCSCGRSDLRQEGCFVSGISWHDEDEGIGQNVCQVAGIDKEVEKSVQACHHCQEQQAAPPVAPHLPWKWPSRPWVRLHMNFAGPLEGKMILVVVDWHSKHSQVFLLHHTW